MVLNPAERPVPALTLNLHLGFEEDSVHCFSNVIPTHLQSLFGSLQISSANKLSSAKHAFEPLSVRTHHAFRDHKQLASYRVHQESHQRVRDQEEPGNAVVPATPTDTSGPYSSSLLLHRFCIPTTTLFPTSFRSIPSACPTLRTGSLTTQSGHSSDTAKHHDADSTQESAGEAQAGP